MMPDCGAKILKLAPRCGGLAALCDVALAGRPVDVGQRLVTEAIENAIEPSRGLLRSRMVKGDILGVNRHFRRDLGGSGITLAGSGRPVFAGDVVAERAFSARNVALAAASASFECAVSDTPDCALDDFALPSPSCWLQP